MRTILHCIICLLVITSISLAADSNWANWRGPNVNGTAIPGTYPVNWDPDKVLWQTAIPGKGFSTPIVWEKQIFLTSGVDGQDTVIALDWDGEPIWQKALGPEKKGRHKNGSGSNPSVVTDGTSLFVFFKSGNFASLSLKGKVNWQKNLFQTYGEDDRYWDFGTSPVLTKKHVIIAHMHDGDSWLAAFDKKTGEVAWKVARNYQTAREGRQGYTTPIVFSHQGKEALLVWGAHQLTAHDATNGNILWSCGDFNPDESQFWPSVASPTLVGDIAIVPCGRDDRKQPRLHGIRLGGSGAVTKTHRLWKRTDTGPFIPNPTVHKGRVYVITDRGRIDCLNPENGESYWSDTFPKGKGKFYCSPLIAGEHLYAIREDGTVFVLGLETDGLDIKSEIKMQSPIIASPIALDNRLFIRTLKHLVCITQ